MQKRIVLLAFLALTGHGERLRMSKQQLESRSPNPSRALAKMLLTVSPALGFNPSGPVPSTKAPFSSCFARIHAHSMPVLMAKTPGFFADGTPWPETKPDGTPFTDDGTLDLSVFDDFIQKLMDASEEDFKALVAQNINQLDSRIYIRICELSEEFIETDKPKYESYNEMSVRLLNTVKTVKEQAQEYISRDQKLFQDILNSMSNEDGEFFLPLNQDELSKLRSTVRSVINVLDEGFVAVGKAAVKKAEGDGYKELVQLIRAALQMFCAEKLRIVALEMPEEAERKATLEILEAIPPMWDQKMKEVLEGEKSICSKDEWLQVVQPALGEAIMGFQSGSQVQASLAEYFGEMLKVASPGIDKGQR
mmetsp:Transcript_73984/g.128379  ORF Transcript_73984/g.128379 Transcript_73984/m.128379 type:complete len:364 (+) Transcript_73984:68-1159(+)